MQKVKLGYLSWNPLNWLKEKPVETATIKTVAGGTLTVPVKTVVAPGYVPPDRTSPEYVAATEYVPGRGLAPAGTVAAATTGSWWEPFLNTAEKMFSAYSNYQVSKSQSAKDAQAMKLQTDLELARIEATKPPTVITVPGIKEPIAVNWSTILKTALIVGGISLGIVLITKKPKGRSR